LEREQPASRRKEMAARIRALIVVLPTFALRVEYRISRERVQRQRLSSVMAAARRYGALPLSG
jgi:hypothetical protein